MTDKKIKYTDLNPRVIMMVADTEAVISDSIRMEIYAEDGSPTKFVSPHVDTINAHAKAMLEAVPNIEMRELLLVLDHLDHMTDNATISALNTAHAIAHSPISRKHDLDEDKMCHAVGVYLDPDEIINTEQVTPENVASHLDRFFTGGLKPN